jgi:hypothetical protein
MYGSRSSPPVGRIDAPRERTSTALPISGRSISRGELRPSCNCLHDRCIILLCRQRSDRVRLLHAREDAAVPSGRTRTRHSDPRGATYAPLGDLSMWWPTKSDHPICPPLDRVHMADAGASNAPRGCWPLRPGCARASRDRRPPAPSRGWAACLPGRSGQPRVGATDGEPGPPTARADSRDHQPRRRAPTRRSTPTRRC